MKKTILLFILFLIIGGGTYFYIKQAPDKGSSGKGWDTTLTVPDTDQIYRIFIAKKTGTHYNLEKKEDGWYVNGKYRVRPAKIDYIFETLRRQRVKFIPTKGASENAVKAIASTGIKVETYDAEGNSILNFYVGGMTSDERGTYMIRENSNQPLVMHIPGWEGGLRVRFWDDPENWRDRSVFRWDPKNIEYLKVDYPRNKSQSFEINKEADIYTVLPVYDITAVAKEAPDQDAVREYLKLYKSKISENFLNDFPGRDSISQQVPFCEITIKGKDAKDQTVDFFPEHIDMEYEMPNVPGRVLANKGSVERYYVNNSYGDFQLVQQLVFGNLFVPYSNFFK